MSPTSQNHDEPRRTIAVPQLGTLLLAVALVLGPIAGAVVNPDDPWAQTGKLQDSHPEPEDEFGATIALDGDTMVVGHPLEDNESAQVGFNVGAVSVYERVGGTWVKQAEFLGEQPRGRLGAAIALDDDTFVTNAPGQYISNSTGTRCPYSTAELYVYEQVGGAWQQTATLQPPGVQPNVSCLGGGLSATHSLSLDGDTLAAGASTSEGTVYIYTRTSDGWVIDQTLTRDDESYGRLDVSEEAGRLVVGSLHVVGGTVNHSAESNGTWAAVNVYDRSEEEWTLTATLNSTQRLAGYRVQLSEDGSTIATTGSPWTGGSNYVPVLVWEETETEWVQTAELYPRDSQDWKPRISDLALDGDTLAVGTWLDDWSPAMVARNQQMPVGFRCGTFGTEAERIITPCATGATYVFRKNAADGGLGQTAKITQRDDLGVDAFGWDASLDQGTLAVGAPGQAVPPDDVEEHVDDPVQLVNDAYSDCCHGAVYTHSGGDVAGNVTDESPGSLNP